MPSNKDTDLVPYETDPALLEAEHDPPRVVHSSPEDDGSLPCEDYARRVLREAMQEADVDPRRRVITLRSYDDGSKHPQDRECHSLEDLVDALRPRAESAWDGDSSARSFGFPGSSFVREVLGEFTARLSKVGWKL